jgi:hypothetical protein
VQAVARQSFQGPLPPAPSSNLRALIPRRGADRACLDLLQSGSGSEENAYYKGASYGWQKFNGNLERVAGGIGLTMKGKNIAYWTTTVLIAFFMGSGGVSQVVQFLGNVHGVVPILGYPMYFFAILGIWKVLGAIAILVPRFPRLKEWAYAGIFFDLTGAAASCAAVGGYGAYAFHVIAPLILAGLTVASWALRPQSRTIGVLFPASSATANVE